MVVISMCEMEGTDQIQAAVYGHESVWVDT